MSSMEMTNVNAGGASGNDDKEEPFISPEKYKMIMKVVLAVGLIFGLVGLIVAIEAFIVLESYQDDFQELVDTWKTAPIMHVSFTNLDCDADTDIELQTVRWRGTSDMCDCECCVPSGNETCTTSFTSSCSSDDIYNGCFDIDGWPSVTAAFFHDPDYKVCATREGYSAENRPRYGFDVKDGCPGDDIICGGTDGSYQFCAKASVGCPVTDFAFAYDTSTEGIAMAAVASEVQAGYTTADGVMTLYMMRGGYFNDYAMEDRSNPDYIQGLQVYGFPLIDLTLESLVPCYLHQGEGYSGRGGEYSAHEDQAEVDFMTGNYCAPRWSTGFVLNYQEDGCDKRVDSRYRPALGRSEREIFLQVAADYTYATSGYAIDTSLMPLVYVTAELDYEYHLSYQTETQWEESTASGCPRRTQVIKNQEEVENLYGAQLALIILSIISFIIVGCLGVIANFIWIGQDDNGKIEEGEEHYKELQYLKYTKWCFKIGMYSCTIASIALAFGLLGIFEAAVEGDGCTDALSSSTFVELEEIIEGLSSRDLVVGFMNAGDGLSDLFGNVVSCMT